MPSDISLGINAVPQFGEGNGLASYGFVPIRNHSMEPTNYP